MMRMLAMTASMLVVGWIVWKAINRREDADADLQRKLDADDRRAADGRRADAGVEDPSKRD